MSQHESQRFAFNHNLFSRSHTWEKLQHQKHANRRRRSKKSTKFDWMNP
ncbi:hypothetical protein [Baaleninema sp.]